MSQELLKLPSMLSSTMKSQNSFFTNFTDRLGFDGPFKSPNDNIGWLQECGLSFRLDLSQRLSRLSRCQGGQGERLRLRGLVSPDERLLVLGSGIGISACVLGQNSSFALGIEKDEVKNHFAQVAGPAV